MRLRQVNCVRWAALVLAASGIAWAASAQVARAQYSSDFHYYNSRTGRSYSQHVGVGDHSAYGGFSYSTPSRNSSVGSGYRGGNYFQTQYYASPRLAYGQRAQYGRGYYHGGTYYSN